MPAELTDVLVQIFYLDFGAQFSHILRESLHSLSFTTVEKRPLNKAVSSVCLEV